MNEPVKELSLADQIAVKKQSLQEAKSVIQSNGSRDSGTGWWSTSNAMTMSGSVLVFGLIVLLALAYQIKKHDITENEARLYIIVLVIVSALFLVVAGYSDTQIAPVMTMLGTIVGWVLKGADQKKTE